MTAVGRRALATATGLVLGVVVLFGLFTEPVRNLEAALVGMVLRMLPGIDEVFVLGPTVVLVPADEVFIRAVLLPSCSALAPVLAMSVLWPLVPGERRFRRASRAVLAAAAVIAVGNFLRLVLSLAAGGLFGRSVLIAFHDTVAAGFGFVYVTAGLLVGLRMLLPADPSPVPPVRHPVQESVPC